MKKNLLSILLLISVCHSFGQRKVLLDGFIKHTEVNKNELGCNGNYFYNITQNGETVASSSIVLVD